MSRIEDYIQFAIDNGLVYAYDEWYIDIDEWWIEWEEYEINFYSYDISKWWNKRLEGSWNLIKLITSKPFIEAIARWLIERDNSSKTEKEIMNKWVNLLIEDITLTQAIAIRENELEDFITNLLK